MDPPYHVKRRSKKGTLSARGSSIIKPQRGTRTSFGGNNRNDAVADRSISKTFAFTNARVRGEASNNRRPDIITKFNPIGSSRNGVVIPFLPICASAYIQNVHSIKVSELLVF